VRRLACIIVIVTILVSGLAFVRIAHATQVSGVLTSDTHWTIDDSPVTFNGTVTVGANVTLTIDPGVTVNLGVSSLQIRGTLIAVGDASNKILFTVRENMSQYISEPIFFTNSSSWDPNTNSGSIIQNAILNKISLYVISSPKIDNCYINFTTTQSAISVSAGAPIISNNIISFNGQDSAHYVTGITVNTGMPIITNNEFDGNGYLTGVSSSDSGTISNNVFSNCWIGVKAQSRSTITVNGNSFLKGNDGLDVHNGASITITNNLIDSNARYGINGGGYIDSNTITNNQIGIHNPGASSIISNNNIVGNTANSITASKESVYAQNNWWGIADTQTINQTIYDNKIDPTLGAITFVPFLSGPNIAAPAITASTPVITPIPSTPTPTQPPQSTPTPTFQPIPPTPTPIPTPISETAKSIISQASDFFNLNLITSTATILLIFVWVIVILGYSVKSGISRYKSSNRKNQKS
jgi:parallel beta-helix repeat protein